MADKTIFAEIDIQLNREYEYAEINNTLLWYDTQEKKMLEFKGGKLEFPYNFAMGRIYPKVVQSSIKNNVIKNNSKKIINWIMANEDLDMEIISSDNRSIVIQFPEHNREEVEDGLYSCRFRYEIIDA